MFKKLWLGILAVSALALFWNEANAQDCLRWRNIGGSQMCVKWTPGSEVCEIKVSGLQGGLNFDDNTSTEPENVSIECNVSPTSGTTLTGSLYCTMPNEDLELAKATQLEGCKHFFNGAGNGHTDSNGQGHAGDCNVRTVSVSVPVPLGAGDIFGLEQCNKKSGICQADNALEIPNGQTLCDNNQGGTFVTFIANSFRGDIFIDGLPGGVSCEFKQICTLSGNGYKCGPLPPEFEEGPSECFVND